MLKSVTITHTLVSIIAHSLVSLSCADITTHTLISLGCAYITTPHHYTHALVSLGCVYITTNTLVSLGCADIIWFRLCCRYHCPQSGSGSDPGITIYPQSGTGCAADITAHSLVQVLM